MIPYFISLINTECAIQSLSNEPTPVDSPSPLNNQDDGHLQLSHLQSSTTAVVWCFFPGSTGPTSCL